MEKMIGKTFNVPEDLYTGIRLLKKEIDAARQSAKYYMKDAQKAKEDLLQIIEENMEEVKGFRYSLDVQNMTVTIIEKDDRQL